MDTHTVPLDSLQLHSSGWTVRVLLLEKSSKRTPRLGGKVYQRYIFVDAEESKIQAVSYAPDVDIVDKVLDPFETYLIENARICRSHPLHRLVENPIQWVLTACTAMELDKPNAFPPTLAQPTFTNFALLPQYRGLSTYIDILALVIDKSEPRTVKYASGNAQVQDLILITEEKTTMALSLWDDMIYGEGAPVLAAANNFPVIAGLRVRVESFRGLSLSARGNANILLNPIYAEALELQAWGADNANMLQAIIHNKSYFSFMPSSPVSSNITPSSIAEILMTQTEGNFSVTATMRLPTDPQSFFYMSCPSCFRHTTAKTVFTCRHCNKKQQATPRTKFTVMVSDNLTQITLVAFGEVAERVAEHTAVELMLRSTKGEPIDADAITARLEQGQYDIHIRKKPAHQEGQYFFNLIDFKLVSAEPTTPSKETPEGSSVPASPTPPTPITEINTASSLDASGGTQASKNARLKAATSLPTTPTPPSPLGKTKTANSAASVEPKRQGTLAGKQTRLKSARLSSVRLLQRSNDFAPAASITATDPPPTGLPTADSPHSKTPNGGITPLAENCSLPTQSLS